ncbi:epoxide hydrolase 4-like [Ptychodera flava]|uniref:epoxide hydrolase 4-like n=1 Tax=Ptychodera flava TaxID=63121 RepID=UPI003969C377
MANIVLKVLAFCLLLDICLFYGVMVALRTLWTIIRHPVRSFKIKPRNTPPACLDDNSLGSHAYLRTKTLKLHYVSNGDRSKPLMLFLHGFPEFWYSWRHQLRAFADDYRVVALDMRGYGDSDKPKGIGAYALDNLTSDVRDAIPALGHSSCVLVAHDWGGAVAWRFAHDYPDLVDKLIIMNSPHLKRFEEVISTSMKQFKKSWYMFFFQLPYLPEFICRMADYAWIKAAFCKPPMGVRSEGAMTDDDIEAFKYNFQQEGVATATINYYRAAMRYPPAREPKHPVITSPTLLIWGEEDQALCIELTEGMDKYVQDVTVKRVPDASHWVQQDKPQEVNQIMREFLKGN